MVVFLIVLLAAVSFCFQNVTVRVLFSPQTLLGMVQTGGFVEPTLPNSFLLLFMRMLLVVPLMGLLVPQFYPPIWQDVRRIADRQHRPDLWRSLLGGVFMFLYLALLYISVGLIPTGIALTLFFSYPVFTALLSWWWFGNRPSRFRWMVMGLVLAGSALTMPHSAIAHSQSVWLGVVMGVASGVVYALYTVNAQKSFETIHPVPFTWLSFAITLVLSTVGLLFWQQTTEIAWGPLWIGGLVSAIATSIGHLLNNLGIRLIGATTAAMVSASNPALTVVLAWVTIQEQLTAVQLLGVALVTFSVVLLSREHRQPE